ncbi:hypothetical protein PAXRUDRAFT_19546 [Paxillus rubicundulus Ve08.2h10]|uniref:Uncharacterized protein n=1 Tax=Paxillus rubicundulus Ve08.2h10 TaxID=930991 RepID=A0A0D0DBZ9_9AGAM|nr:hypothetical protein PAXRUDRAFT_19546 [Paxillus rubicundulus Ve08.2h10]
MQHGLGDTPDPDIEDLYELMHQFPLAYVPDNNPQVQEEMLKMNDEIKNHVDDSKSGNVDMHAIDSDSDSEDSEAGDTSSLGADLGSESGKSKATEKVMETRNESKSSTWKTQKDVKSSQRKKFTVINKLHAIVIDILSSEAITQWVESMDQDQCLSSKKKQATQKKKKRLQLSLGDWDFLEHFCEILIRFHTSTLSLQKKGILTIFQTLPLYKQLEKHLEDHIARVSKRLQNKYRLKSALNAGLEKLTYHMEKALKSNFLFLGTATTKCYIPHFV